MSRCSELDFAGLARLSHGLRPQSLVRLRESAVSRFLPAKSLLIKQGEPPSHLFVIRQGCLRLFHLTAGGTPIGLGFATTGDPVGAVAVLKPISHPASAYAVTDTSVIGWTKAQLEAIGTDDPALLWNILPALCDQALSLTVQLREFVTEPVEQRIARALLRLAGPPRDGAPVRTPPVSRQDIAELTGTTHFTVSRVLKTWLGQGIVANDRPRILLRDMRRLRDISEGVRATSRQPQRGK